MLVLHGFSTRGLWLLVTLLCLVLPGCVVMLELMLWRRLPLIRAALHVAVITELTGFVALHTLGVLGGDSQAIILGAGAIGFLGGVGYLQLAPVRAFYTALAPAVLVVPLFFLAHPTIRGLMEDERSTMGPAGSATRAVPVVILVFDEFPLASLLDEHLRVNEARFPHFAALAEEAVWWRNATTVASQTIQAIPAVLTGKLPDGRSSPFERDHPKNLFSLLRGNLPFQAREAVTRLSGSDADGAMNRSLVSHLWLLGLLYERWLLPPALQQAPWESGSSSALDEQEPTGFGYSPVEEADRFNEFVASIRPGSEASLRFYHCVLPHAPWRWLPSGRSYAWSARLPPEGSWSQSRWEAIHGLQRHLLQVGFVDTLLGRLIRRLKQTGLYEDTLLIVTADHGTSFVPGASSRELVKGHVDQLMRVPLFVKLPRALAGEVRDEPAQIVDILPSVAEILGLDVPWPLDGQSLLGSHREPRRRFLFGCPEVAALPSDLASSVQRQASLFGPDFGPRFYAVGPCAELVGKRVTDVPHGPVADTVVRLEREARMSEMGVCVEGTLPSVPRELPEAVAIVLDGRIRAVSDLISDGDRLRFAAMLPEECLNQAGSRVRIFLVQRGMLRAALVP